MSIRNKLALLRKSKGGRFLDLSVGGELICDVTPLGNWLTPGVTKAGRISFRGMLCGKKVKIYSVHSPEQVALRIFLSEVSFAGFAFPAVLAYDDRLVVEEWIEGRQMKATADFETKVAMIIDELHESTVLIKKEWLKASPFCYFQDYLIPRLERWLAVRQVADFIDLWRDAKASLGTTLKPQLCHPDLTFRNMIECPNSGRPVIVDNELLGVSSGWVLDWYNAGIAGVGMDKFSSNEELHSFTQLSWKLRRMGSLLDACDYKGLRSLLS